MSHTDERQMVALLQQADRDVQTRLYQESVRELASVCRRFLPADEDVRDELHDAYITIFTSVGGFEYRGKGTLAAWMRRVAVNQCITVLRRRKRQFVVPIDELDAAERARAEADSTPDFTESDLTQVPADVLHALIASLPTGYRTVLNLFAIEGLSHKEIAAMLGISASTSASQYSRAKRLLTTLILQYTQQHQ